MGKLDIRIVEAKQLYNQETFGKSDPYVVVTCEGKSYKTTTKPSTLTPQWNEKFTFMVADQYSSQVKIEVFDNNVFSDKAMGYYSVSLSGLTKGKVLDDWFILNGTKSGQIHVRLMAVDFGLEPKQNKQQPQPTAPPQQYQQQPPPQQYQQQPPPQQYQQQPPPQQYQQQPPQQYQQPPPQQYQQQPPQQYQQQPPPQQYQQQPPPQQYQQQPPPQQYQQQPPPQQYQQQGYPPQQPYGYGGAPPPQPAYGQPGMQGAPAPATSFPPNPYPGNPYPPGPPGGMPGYPPQGGGSDVV